MKKDKIKYNSPDSFKGIAPANFVMMIRENKFRKTDIENVQGVYFKYGINAEVLNVIIHYIVKSSSLKLVGGTLEDLAAKFLRYNITTAEEAMTYLQSNKNHILNKVDFCR